MNWIFREPEPDPKLGRALRELESGFEAGDADRLRARILESARPRLAGLRSPGSPPWWEWISRSITVALPVGLAASLIAGLMVPIDEELRGLGSYNTDAGTDSTLVNAAFAEASVGSELASRLVAPASGEWLFEQVLSQ